METLVTVTLALAWAAILGMMGWSIATGTRRMLKDEGRLPLFGMLEHRGIALDPLERSPEVLAAAVRRCAMCRERQGCSERLEKGIGDPAPSCPNAAFFDRV